MTYKLPYTIPNPVPIDDCVIEHDTFKAYYRGRLLSKKRRFEYKCRQCDSVSISSRGNQMKRKFPWTCDSCCRKLEWDTFTREERQQRQKKTIDYNRQKHIRERNSKIMKRQWQDPDSYWNTTHISPMLKSEVREKMSQIMKNKLMNDKGFRIEFLERMKNNARGTLIKFQEPKGKLITLRSTYELRVATYLNEQGLDWQYEPKTFYIKALDKTYTPDFYIPKLDTWIEVKGIWQNQSELKWNEFCKTHNNALLFKCDIENLENGASLEDQINYIQQ
jgi:hypothetical protein